MTGSRSKIENRESKIAILVAVSDNGVIGRAGELPWRLPDDLKRFKRLTMGQTIVMGRKTYESIGRPLPGRRNIVVTRQQDWRAPGVAVAHSVDEAIGLASGTRTEYAGIPAKLEVSHDRPCEGDGIFIIGGEAIYAAAMPRADRLYVTHVHVICPGDARFGPIPPERWQAEHREHHPADAQHAYPFTFTSYRPRRD